MGRVVVVGSVNVDQVACCRAPSPTGGDGARRFATSRLAGGKGANQAVAAAAAGAEVAMIGCVGDDAGGAGVSASASPPAASTSPT